MPWGCCQGLVIPSGMEAFSGDGDASVTNLTLGLTGAGLGPGLLASADLSWPEIPAWLDAYC